MSRTALSWVCRSLIGALAMAVALATGAASATGADAVDATAGLPAPPPAPADPGGVLGVDLLKTGLYLITGGGSNSLLRLSPSGAILVDGKQAGAYRALMSQVRRISKLSDLPARVVIVTDHHPHHTGNHAQFLMAGIAVIAQQNAVPRLPDVTLSAAMPGAPVVTFDRQYTLRMGGVEVDLRHFGSAHSDNDTVVHFPDLKIVAVGDLYAADGPVPDFAAGGSLVGWGRVLAQLLTLDFDVAVPSVGPLLTRADLVDFKRKLEILSARAAALVHQGVAKDQRLAQLRTDDLGWRLNFSAEQLDRLCEDLASSQ